VPRDRSGSFEPQIVRKGQTRLEGFNERVIALYARGMTVRDIRAHLREMYDVDVSPDLISRVTDGVLEELQEWQSRPLDQAWFLTVVANPGQRGFACRGMRRTRCRKRSSAVTSS
jgi:putative transposase